MPDGLPGTLKYDSKRHLIVETPLSRWLATEFPGRGLFTYRHLQHNSTVIARWLSRDRGEIDEILVLEGNAEFTRANADWLHWFMATPLPVQRDEIRATIGIPEREMDASNELYTRTVADRAAALQRKRGGSEVAKSHPMIQALRETPAALTRG